MHPRSALEAYPIGAVYMSFDATSPAELFGGSWARIEGRFLFAADASHAAGSTGGAASVTSGGTAITIEQMPMHNHQIYMNEIGEGEYVGPNAPYISNQSGRVYTNSGLVGGGQPHIHTVDIMPPYLAVYMWQRVA